MDVRRFFYQEICSFGNDAAIKNFQYAYGYFSSNCPLKD